MSIRRVVSRGHAENRCERVKIAGARESARFVFPGGRSGCKSLPHECAQLLIADRGCEARCIIAQGERLDLRRAPALRELVLQAL